MAMTSPLLVEGISTIACIYLLTLFLHMLLPGQIIEGYACSEDNGSNDKMTGTNPQQARTPKVLTYKLNGALVLMVSIPLTIILCDLGLSSHYLDDDDKDEDVTLATLKAAAKFCERIGGCVIGGNLCGVLTAIAFYRRGKNWISAARDNGLDVKKMEKASRCLTKDQLVEYSNDKAGKSPSDEGVIHDSQEQRIVENMSAVLEKFYLGKGEFNPRSILFWRVVDWKMWLYLAGTVGLEMHVLSMVAAHALLQDTDGDVISRAMASSAAMWTWFCFDYLTHEHVHLYTYDLFAERLGIKLIWGCLGVYPFLYPAALHGLVRKIDRADDLSGQSTFLVLALFLFGWILTRGANDQKFAFKIDSKKKDFSFCGIKVKQLSCEVGAGGGRGPRKILVGGWWGLARHVNYMGEMVQGLAVSLPAFIITGSPLSLIYFFFITALLVPRQKEDDIICRGKYGKEGWDEYTRLVPSKIVPFFY